MKKTPAQFIKAELKKAFPNTQFSCAYKSYTGGDSVTISWVDGPTQDQVRGISSKYQAGNFDSMIDSYEYNNHRDDIPQAKYVFENRTIAPEKETFVHSYLDGKLIFRGSDNEKYLHIASWARRIFSKNQLLEGQSIIGVDLKNDLLLFAP